MFLQSEWPLRSQGLSPSCFYNMGCFHTSTAASFITRAALRVSVMLAELYRSCSIAPVSLSIGPAQTSREASGISQSIVELDDPGSIVCSVYLVIPSIGSAGVYSVFQDILILIWTCWNCYDPWVIPTVRYSYNRCSSRYHNPCFKYYILNFNRNCCYISINLFCILFCFYFGPSIH